MRIFQTANRGSTVLFLKIISIAACACLILYLSVFLYDFLGYKTIVYNDLEHVLQVFSENEDDFQKMSETLTKTNITGILLDEYLQSSDPIMLCPGESLRNPKYQIRRKNLLSSDDYKIISSFFKKYSPGYVDGREAYAFCFYTKNHPVHLHYIPAENSSFFINELERYYSDLTHIKDDWYYSE